MSSTSSKSDNLLNSLTTDWKIPQHPKAIAATASSIQPRLSVKKLVSKPSSYQELRRVLKKKNRQIKEARLAEIRTPKQARAAAEVAARQARDAAERARDTVRPRRKSQSKTSKIGGAHAGERRTSHRQVGLSVGD